MHRAKSISGVTSHDATATITICLLARNGALENVLALPATGLVPTGTPIKDMSAHPPRGAGPYSPGTSSQREGEAHLR